ncbi:MAG: PEGA domain-containing protein [Lachnospiraceae bacterium]|nr:PEGA domain-containing protein [Lachnospiraceae bacterium]
MQLKRNIIVKNLISILITLFAFLTISGCANKLSEQSAMPSQVTVSEEAVISEETVTDIPELEMDDLAVFVEYMPEKGDIRLLSTDNGKTYTVSVNDLTTFSDKYGRVSVAELFEPGMIVNAKISIHAKTIKELSQDPNTTERRDVTGFEINMNRGIFKLDDGTNLHITENTAVFKNGKRIKAESITDSDTLIVRSIGHELYSIVITSGYGHLRIKGTQFFSGGWIQVAGMIRPVPDDTSMLLDVPEGEYDLVVTYKGRGGSKSIAVNRGRETVVDVSDMKEDLVKTGELIFTIRPLDAVAKVKIDGKEIDQSNPVTLEYGVYMMEVSAPGYITIKERISVGSELSNVNIELQQSSDDEEEKEKEESKDKSDKEETGNENETDQNDWNNLKPLDNYNTTGNKTGNTSSTSSSSSSSVSGDSAVLYGNHIYIEAPEKAEVYFDGIYKGIVPCSFAKEAGTHVITLRRDGYEPRTFTVNLDTTTQNETYSFSELQAK